MKIYEKQNGESQIDKKYHAHDPKQPNKYFGGRRGLQYKISIYSPSGELKLENHFFKERMEKFAGIFKSDYGIYYGGTSVYEFNDNHGVNREFKYDISSEDIKKMEIFTSDYEYNISPIDAVDNGAMEHDIAYDKIDAVGGDSFFNDWATIPADLKAIADWQEVINIGENGEDPVTYEKITSDEVDAAESGVTLFKGVVLVKKTKVAEWMWENHKNVSLNIREIPDDVTDRLTYVRKRVEHNYIQFRNKYMKKVGKYWERIPENWIDDVPKTNI